MTDIFTEPTEPKEPPLSPEDEALRNRIIDFFFQVEQDYCDGFPVGGRYLVHSFDIENEEELVNMVMEFVKEEGSNEREKCYCVCHSSLSSCPVCEHCRPAVQIAGRQGYLKGIEASEGALKKLLGRTCGSHVKGGYYDQCDDCTRPEMIVREALSALAGLKKV